MKNTETASVQAIEQAIAFAERLSAVCDELGCSVAGNHTTHAADLLRKKIADLSSRCVPDQ